MKKRNALSFAICMIVHHFLFSLVLSSQTNQKPLTVAESSNYKATSRYDDVRAFIDSLQKKTSLFRVETLCKSTEGRDVPLLVIGNPVPSSPLDLKYDDRAVVYIQANIHAGEVEGKEASLMLARDILLQKNPSYLDKLIILIAPIFNADGNEKISTENRRNQVGPEKGVGVRYNGQKLDLNRDCMKMESPEIQGLVRNVLMRWDPALVVDCHTTNGSYHEEPVTYAWPLNPNGDASIIEYMRSKMMPFIQKNLKEKYNTLSIPYGNFMDFKNPEKGWGTFGHQPRYVTNYIGLRNRLSILDENYAYSDYKTRVYGCYHFLISILDYCYSYKNEIVTLVRQTDRKTIQRGLNPSPSDSFAVEFEVKPLEEPVTILGWEMEYVPDKKGWPPLKKLDKKKIYTIPHYADCVPKRSIPFPYGYLIPISAPKILEKLLQHGIVVEKLTEATTLEVELFKLKEMESDKKLYQGHHLNSVKGEYVLKKEEFPAGTFFIGTAQPLGNLAASLLEPESDDGLLVWNFFDRYLVSQWRRELQTFPVYRLLKPVRLVKETVR